MSLVCISDAARANHSSICVRQAVRSASFSSSARVRSASAYSTFRTKSTFSAINLASTSRSRDSCAAAVLSSASAWSRAPFAARSASSAASRAICASLNPRSACSARSAVASARLSAAAAARRAWSTTSLVAIICAWPSASTRAHVSCCVACAATARRCASSRSLTAALTSLRSFVASALTSAAVSEAASSIPLQASSCAMPRLPIAARVAADSPAELPGPESSARDCSRLTSASCTVARALVVCCSSKTTRSKLASMLVSVVISVLTCKAWRGRRGCSTALGALSQFLRANTTRVASYRGDYERNQGVRSEVSKALRTSDVRQAASDHSIKTATRTVNGFR